MCTMIGQFKELYFHCAACLNKLFDWTEIFLLYLNPRML